MVMGKFYLFLVIYVFNPSGFNPLFYYFSPLFFKDNLSYLMLSLIFFIVFSNPFPVLYSPKFSPCPASFSMILIIFLALLFNSFPIFYVPFMGILFYLLLAFFLIFFTLHPFLRISRES